MGKRETKTALKDSERLRQESDKRYQDLLNSSYDRTQAPATGESSGESSGGSGSATGGEYRFEGDTPYFAGDDARTGEGRTSLDDQRDYLTKGYQDIYSNIERLKDPNKINTSELRDTLGGYKAFRDTGGLSEDNINRIRGMGGYDEFSKTGGYTPESIANIKAQALSPISSYATGTKDELARRAALQGGYAPGFDAASRQLQRDSARAIADTSLNANVGIQDRINAGRQWGIGGLANAESGLANLQSGNRLSALGGEAGIGNSLSGYDAQDISNAMNTGMFNIQNAQNMKLAGLGGLGGLYEGGMGRLENAYNRDYGAQQAAYNRDFSGTQSALDRDLTRSESALNRNFSGSQAEYNRQLAILQAMGGQNLGYLNNQSQLAMQPGIGGNILGAIGSGAGLASGFFPRNRGIGGLTPTAAGSGTAMFDPYRGYW